jgi:hypothetical protein
LCLWDSKWLGLKQFPPPYEIPHTRSVSYKHKPFTTQELYNLWTVQPFLKSSTTGNVLSTLVYFRSSTTQRVTPHRSIARVFCIQTSLSEQSSPDSEGTSSVDIWDKIQHTTAREISCCTMALELTASNRNEYQEYFLGVKAAGAYGWWPYHLYVPIVLKYGSLNLLEPSEFVQACNGIAFTARKKWNWLFLHIFFNSHPTLRCTQF